MSPTLICWYGALPCCLSYHITCIVLQTICTDWSIPSGAIVDNKKMKENERQTRGRTSLKYEPQTFTWDKLAANATYIIRFYKRFASTPLFSACAMNTSYKLPSAVFREIFKPGMKYYWKVKGSGGKEEAESPLREFRFKTIKYELRAYALCVQSVQCFEVCLDPCAHL